VTFLPVERRDVIGLKGPKYKVAAYCCNPRCSLFSQQAHHMWRRSEIIANYDWVEVDGWIVAGKVPVCLNCHHNLTVNRESIQLDETERLFYWCIVTGSKTTGDLKHNRIGLIEPQPPTPEALAALDAPDQPGSEEGCPFCGQLKRRRSQGRALRRRKSWTVKVPDEEIEDGAAVLDAMIENLAPFVPNADASATGRYYVLVPVLAYASLNTKNFVETMEGVGG
jgi:hypothetical protein